MLEEISKKDKQWRDYALRLCGCKQLADDIVQETYLRIYRNPKSTINDYYMCLLIKSVYYNMLKVKKREISIEKLYYVNSNENTFEPDDLEKEILDRYEKLDWKEKELLAEIYDRSLKEIERLYPMINYAYAFRQIKHARQKVLKCLKK